MAFCYLVNFLTPLLMSTVVRSAAVIAPEDVVRTFSLANSTTVTDVITITASEATTTTKSALLTCTTLAAPQASTSCRGKKQSWAVPVFYTIVHEDIDQFHSVNPTQVLKVEPSVLAMPEESLKNAVIESSVNDGTLIHSSSRFADPNLLSTFFSSLLSGLNIPTIATVTSTETVYSATRTVTLFTSTTTYTLSAAACLPADFVSCPVEIEEMPMSTTQDPEYSTDGN